MTRPDEHCSAIHGRVTMNDTVSYSDPTIHREPDSASSSPARVSRGGRGTDHEDEYNMRDSGITVDVTAATSGVSI